MNEKDITRLCVAISIVGIIIIYIADTEMEPEKITGMTLSESTAGERVILCGKVADIRSSESGTVFFRIDDGKKTDIVLFENRATRAVLEKIKNGNDVCVTGTAEEYRGRMEILASKVG